MLSRNLDDTLPESIIIELVTLSDEEQSWVRQCRGDQNRLVFCYKCYPTTKSALVY
ncbi:MAG: hypothetical protein JW855_02575 [Gammaproteobacteria bacterium]|nr:hypothetical protein [Gammaproteobacteria bacterium]